MDRESKYFEVVGPHGGPIISEVVQILQHYSEVIGPGCPNTSKWTGGNYFRGVHFFRDSTVKSTVARHVTSVLLNKFSPVASCEREHADMDETASCKFGVTK